VLNQYPHQTVRKVKKKKEKTTKTSKTPKDKQKIAGSRTTPERTLKKN